MGGEDKGFDFSSSFGSSGRGENSAKGIGNNIFFASLVLEGGTKLINEDAPAQDVLSVEFGKVVSEVLVITVNKDFIAKEKVPAFL